MLARQSLYALCALGFLCAVSGPASAGPRNVNSAPMLLRVEDHIQGARNVNSARFAQGETMVHIESASPGPSRGRLGKMGIARSGTNADPSNVELVVKVLNTQSPASSRGSYRLRFFNNPGR
jgi:hypothetical protein